MRPNILIVMTDHQRGDTVFPEHPAQTPNLDQFLADGLAFTQTFTPMAHCCPARASFMSGLYPSRHGVWNNVCNEQALNHGLKDGVKLWSEELAASGYQMHFTGKWHISSLTSPQDHGWQEHYVSGKSPNEHGLSWKQIRKQAANWSAIPPERQPGEIKRPGFPPYCLYDEVKDMDPHDKHVTRQTLDLLGSLKDADQPWCLFTGFIGPHDPYKVEKKYLDLYDPDKIALPESYSDDLQDKPGLYRRIRQFFSQLPPEEVREAIRHFYAYCSFLDDQFGQILQKLAETGQQENTLVIYCSDHGDYCGEHGLFAKGIPCFRGAYHVPAVIRWPAGIEEPGRRVDELVSLIDFAPTLLELAELKPSCPLSGRSLTPFLRNEPPETWRDALLTQCNGVELYASQRAVITQNYKYVLNGFDFDELYDLQADPGEINNLAESAEYQEIKAELCKKLWLLAEKEQDTQTNPYITVGFAPQGPGCIMEP